MARKALEAIDQERLTVTAIVKRYGGKFTNIPSLGVSDWQETLLLVEVRNLQAEVLTDHVWFKVGKRFETLDAQTGDTIQFDARVDRYTKRDGTDFHFEYPTKLKIIASDPTLFPEEVARTVGTGIEHAQRLKESYQNQSGKRYQNGTQKRSQSQLEPFQVRGHQINHLRQAHQAGLIVLPPEMLRKGGFKKISNDEITRLFNETHASK